MENNTAQTMLKELLRFKQDDPLFRAVIAEPEGVPEDPILRPTDYNQGAVASVLEYTRKLGIDLIKNLDLRLASTKWLTYALETVLGIVRLTAETNEEWLNRVINLIFQEKTTPNIIIEALLPYSTPLEPEVTVAGAYRGFYGRSYYSFLAQVQAAGPAWIAGSWIFSARYISDAGTQLFFVVTVYNATAAQIDIIVAIVNELKAAGIGWELVIRTV